MTKNGMNIAEKSMEKTRFYNREDLKAKDVARLISIWEGEAGESFTDYCNFSREADKNFLLFLAEKYPILYDYHCKVAGNDWLDHCIQYVVDHCGEYLTQWVPAEEKNPLAGGMYHIELVRPVTREEIEEDNSRWWGYEIGSNTNAFHSPEDVIALAKEVCKARFKGNWILKIVDYSGKDLDEEILIDKL